MSGGLGLAISWEPCFISTRHLFLSRWSLINQESRASLFTGHQLLISKLAFGSSLKHGSEEGHQEVVGTSYSGKEKESLVLTPTNGIWWLPRLRLLPVERFRVTGVLRLGRQWVTFMNLLSRCIVREEVSACLSVSSPNLPVGHNIVECTPYVSWKAILQVHCPHWLSHSLSHCPPGCRFQQLFTSPQRIHLYQSISEQCGLTDNYGMENIYTATPSAKFRKYTHPLLDISLSQIPLSSTGSLRAPSPSCLLPLHPGTRGPLTSLPHVTRAFRFILPLPPRPFRSFLLYL